MIRLSKTTQAAIAALPALVRATEPVRHWRVAQDYQLSPRKLQSAFWHLSTAGILKGKRGPHGGYLLARPARETFILAIVEALEGPLHLTTEDEFALMGRVNQLLGTSAWTALRDCTLDDLRRAAAGHEIP